MLFLSLLANFHGYIQSYIQF